MASSAVPGQVQFRIGDHNGLLGLLHGGAQQPQRFFQLFALGDIAKGPDSSVVFSVFSNHGSRVAVQHRSILKLNLIAADFIRVCVKSGDFFHELAWIFGHVPDPLNLFPVVFVVRDVPWDFEQVGGPLVL